MKYIDFHFVHAAARSGEIKFNFEEVNFAINEMTEKNVNISSFSRHGFFLGLAQDQDGKTWLAIYGPNGEWLANVGVEPDGSAIFREMQTPMPVAYCWGTGIHAGSLRYKKPPSEEFPDSHDWNNDAEIDRLENKLNQLGYGTVKKRGMHLTDHSMEVLAAGGSASARANAVLLRFEAIVKNPGDQELIADIVDIEMLERSWWKNVQKSGDAE